LVEFEGKDDVLFLTETAVTLALCPHRYTKLQILKFLELKGQDGLYTSVFKSQDLDLKRVGYGRSMIHQVASLSNSVLHALHLLHQV